MFGTSRIQDGLPVLFNNPIIKLFGWSPLVEDAFKINQHLFALSPTLPPSTPQLRYPPIPGLLALHVRRGDFEGHCPKLRRSKTRFTGLNTQPGTIDKSIELEENWVGSSTQASIDAFQKACYPNVTQIVERVRQIRMTEEGEGLRNIFIMTNGSPEWIEELRDALMMDHPWEQIASSLQMQVSWEQKFVAQAVDMMIGQRADVFIGNGVSASTHSRSPLVLINTCSFLLLVLKLNRRRLHAPYHKWPRGWASETLVMRQSRSFPQTSISSSHPLHPTHRICTTPHDPLVPDIPMTLK